MAGYAFLPQTQIFWKVTRFRAYFEFQAPPKDKTHSYVSFVFVIWVLGQLNHTPFPPIPQDPREKVYTQWSILIIPVLGKWRQVDSWGLLASLELVSSRLMRNT